MKDPDTALGFDRRTLALDSESREAHQGSDNSK